MDDNSTNDVDPLAAFDELCAAGGGVDEQQIKDLVNSIRT